MKHLYRLVICGLCLCPLVTTLAANPAENGAAPLANSGEILNQWKALMQQKNVIDKEVDDQITVLRTRAQKGSPQEQQEIMREGQQLQMQYEKKYQAIFAQMRPLAAQLDYKADPETVPEAQMLLQLTYRENLFAAAAAIADRLIASGNAPTEVLVIGGLSHYADHQFTKAQELLNQAKPEIAANPSLSSFLTAAENYPALWEKEKALRKAEATTDNNPRVLLKTDRGNILLELFEDQAPNTVANFISLVESGFYNGIAFHRVMPGFMAQGGDPNSKDDDPRNDGSGGPGYTIKCECDRPDTRMHFAGSLSMAHAGKNTGGSQFFITHLPTDHLNGRHTVFGRVLEGLPVARALRGNDKIESATVVRKRDHTYVPQTSKK